MQRKLRVRKEKRLNNNYDRVIIGGGASGLTAAIIIKKNNPKLSVAILEKKEKVGKKLSQTGNGRANISNTSCDNQDEVMGFFSFAGIYTRADSDGRIYPYSEDAGQLVRTLEKKAISLGVDIFRNSEVTRIEPGFSVKLVYNGVTKFINADKILIAAGGKSYASFGTTGDGFRFARELGHTVTPLIPALTAVEVKENVKSLKGVRAKARVTLLEDGKEIFIEDGEIQFRDDSISGICIMNMSLYIKKEHKYQICVDFAPDMPESALTENWSTVVKDTVADYVKSCGNSLKDVRFTATGLKGWQEAQVTLGGVPYEEVDQNMQSKHVPGLYFSGEVLEYAGPCGGFNLHHAFLTGIRAGKAMSK